MPMYGDADPDQDDYVWYPDAQALPRPTTDNERALRAAYHVRQASRVAIATAGIGISVLVAATKYAFGGALLAVPAEVVAFENTPLDATRLQETIFGVAFILGVVATHAVVRKMGWDSFGDDVATLYQSFQNGTVADRTKTTVAMLDTRYDSIQPQTLFRPGAE